ncbi:hypothetical protein OAX78_01230 [Planctomycetota bacterium]|nr:hypothetical protein [Planctomycetota bacterium]
MENHEISAAVTEYIRLCNEEGLSTSLEEYCKAEHPLVYIRFLEETGRI